MQPEQRKEFSELMDATMPVYRMEASAATKLLWWNLLINYSIEDVATAFAEHLRTSKFAPTPAEIVTLIDKLSPDGRPGADEAWAMMPRDEYASVVMTEEMAQALHIAQPLLDEGDQVAARIAFKEAYTRLVDTSKRAGTPAKWFPSLGQDKSAREACLAEAVRLGRLGADHAIELLPPDKVASMLEHSGNKTLAIEYKPANSETVKDNLARMKALLTKSPLMERSV